MSWRGWSMHLAIETVLAHAVRRRGGDPVFVYCGGRLPICDVMPVTAAPPMPCHSCREYASGAIAAAGFDSLALRDVMDVEATVRIARKRVAALTTVSDCERYVDQGLPLGELVRVSVAWFLSRGSLPDTPEVVDTYRSFLVSGIVVARGLRTMLERTGAQRLFMLNGSFFAESIMSAIAEQRKIPFATYEKGFIHDGIVVTPQAAASRLTMPPASGNPRATRALSIAESGEIDAYLDARRRGAGTLDNFWRNSVEDVSRIRHTIASRAGPATCGHVLQYPVGQCRGRARSRLPVDGRLGGRRDRWAASHPEADLVIRIHPAEVGLRNHPTRERMADHIAAHAGVAPPECPRGASRGSDQLVRVHGPGHPRSGLHVDSRSRAGCTRRSRRGRG